MRVICALREIMEELGLNKSYLVDQLGVVPKTLDKLIADSAEDPWRLDRDALYRYLLFAHANGFEAFRIAPHPIWRTFENDNDIVIFRGSNRADAPVEDHLNRYFAHLHSITHPTTVFDGIEEKMKQNNCVVIGSPKFNRASEIALALLWGAKPFDASAENRKRIPLHFLGMELDPPEDSALLIESRRHGFNVQIPSASHRSYLKVDYLPAEEYGPSTEDGQDGAALVVCNRPLGTEKDVTTVVIAGYTGLSTLEATREATYKKIPDLSPADTPGKSWLALLKFGYKKRAQRQRTSLNLRTLKEGTLQWGPPWGEFFE